MKLLFNLTATLLIINFIQCGQISKKEVADIIKAVPKEDRLDFIINTILKGYLMENDSSYEDDSDDQSLTDDDIQDFYQYFKENKQIDIPDEDDCENIICIRPDMCFELDVDGAYP